MNPTTRSLLFWMVPVVVVVLIWNLSSQFQTGDTSISFSEFILWVETGQVDRMFKTGEIDLPPIAIPLIISEWRPSAASS